MTNAVETYLKYANVQMASEAVDLSRGMTGPELETTLINGNTRTNRFPDALAKSFSEEYLSHVTRGQVLPFAC